MYIDINFFMSPKALRYILYSLFVTQTLGVPTGSYPSHNDRSSLSISSPLRHKLGRINNILKNDQLRLEGILSTPFNHKHSPGSVSVPTIDLGLSFQMTTNVQVGNPPTTFEILVDTGSSNLIVGASNVTYKPTTTSVNTGESVFVSFGVDSGFVNGTEFLDHVTLGGVTAVNQSIAASMVSSGFETFDGILGLGPPDLTAGTLVNSPQTIIPTLPETLAAQKKIASPLVALTVPIAADPNGGSIDFGAPNPEKFYGNIEYTPVLRTGIDSLFWGLNQSITYGNKKLEIMNATSGFVDSGTSLLLLPTPAYQAYAEATNATFNNDIGLLEVDNPKSLQSLYFHIGENTFEFTPNAQIFPHSFLSQISNVNPKSTFLIIADAGPTITQEIGFINGFVFLQRFYSVFDLQNARFGLATSKQTFATSN